MEEKKVIVIYGGSFNPPLNSHFSLAQNIVNEIKNLEKIIFVPVSNLYEKVGIISNEHRYNMLKLVCDDNDKFEVSDIELKESRQLSTLETLTRFRDMYPEYELLFATGTDNLKTFNTWKNVETLLEQYKILVLERNNDNMNEIIENSPLLSRFKNSFVNLNEYQRNSLSSSIAREMLKNKKDIRYLTPDKVYKYILENRLYQ